MNILTINSGSSSLKASLFKADGQRLNFRYAPIGVHGDFHNHAEALDCLLRDLGTTRPDVVGHRFVHGGGVVDAARQLNDKEIARLHSITHLAPLHMPANLLGVELCHQYFDVPQIACFDTSFHATLPELAWRLPIPSELGFRRFGFHGLNYAYIAQQLPKLIGDIAYGHVVIAHLGSGTSLCSMKNLKSIDTSMGYSPAGGVVMGTRSGDIDPGILLELAKHYDEAQLSWLIYHQMGLLALSDGESSEMSELLVSKNKAARFAVQYYCHQICAAIGAYAAKAGGIDALVFTGGIGEHSAEVRTLICNPLQFLGFIINTEANLAHNTMLNMPASKPTLLVPSDEELEIARLVTTLQKI